MFLFKILSGVKMSRKFLCLLTLFWAIFSCRPTLGDELNPTETTIFGNSTVVSTQFTTESDSDITTIGPYSENVKLEDLPKCKTCTECKGSIATCLCQRERNCQATCPWWKDGREFVEDGHNRETNMTSSQKMDVLHEIWHFKKEFIVHRTLHPVDLGDGFPYLYPRDAAFESTETDESCCGKEHDWKILINNAVDVAIGKATGRTVGAQRGTGKACYQMITRISESCLRSCWCEVYGVSPSSHFPKSQNISLSDEELDLCGNKNFMCLPAFVSCFTECSYARCQFEEKQDLETTMDSFTTTTTPTTETTVDIADETETNYEEYDETEDPYSTTTTFPTVETETFATENDENVEMLDVTTNIAFTITEEVETFEENETETTSTTTEKTFETSTTELPLYFSGNDSATTTEFVTSTDAITELNPTTETTVTETDAEYDELTEVTGSTTPSSTTVHSWSTTSSENEFIEIGNKTAVKSDSDAQHEEDGETQEYPTTTDSETMFNESSTVSETSEDSVTMIGISEVENTTPTFTPLTEDVESTLESWTENATLEQVTSTEGTSFSTSQETTILTEINSTTEDPHYTTEAEFTSTTKSATEDATEILTESTVEEVPEDEKKNLVDLETTTERVTQSTSFETTKNPMETSSTHSKTETTADDEGTTVSETTKDPNESTSTEETTPESTTQEVDNSTENVAQEIPIGSIFDEATTEPTTSSNFERTTGSSFDETTREATTTSSFDTTTAEATSSSIFDRTTTEQTTSSIFDRTTTEATRNSSFDDAAAEATTSNSSFDETTTEATTTSSFDSTTTDATSSSIFDRTTTEETTSNKNFDETTTEATSSSFDSTITEATTGVIFDRTTTEATTSNSIFDETKSEATINSIFDGTTTDETTSSITETTTESSSGHSFQSTTTDGFTATTEATAVPTYPENATDFSINLFTTSSPGADDNIEIGEESNASTEFPFSSENINTTISTSPHDSDEMDSTMATTQARFETPYTTESSTTFQETLNMSSGFEIETTTDVTIPVSTEHVKTGNESFESGSITPSSWTLHENLTESKDYDTTTSVSDIEQTTTETEYPYPTTQKSIPTTRKSHFPVFSPIWLPTTTQQPEDPMRLSLDSCVKRCLAKKCPKKQEKKRGYCPVIFEVHPCPWFLRRRSVDRCQEDNDCPNPKVCCFDGCHKSCYDGLSKPPLTK